MTEFQEYSYFFRRFTWWAMTNNKLKYLAIGLFIFLGVAWMALKFITGNFEKSNIYTVSEIRHDDSTYRYVKEKCDSGFFEENSQNCINLRKAR